MRKLATVRRVAEIHPIDGADRIELAIIDGWQCVVQKGLFSVGDLGVYFEIDSKLPPGEDWTEFLAPRRWKVKTIKLRKTLSQGLLLPFSQVPSCGGISLGDDLTEKLKVTLIADNQKDDVEPKKLKKWYMYIPPFSWFYHLFNPSRKYSFPKFLRKTDEERVQNIAPSVLSSWFSKDDMYASEKLDGQSVTYFYNRNERRTLWHYGLFGVCSRNLWYPTKVDNNWWNVAVANDIESKLKNWCERHKRSIAIQGEIVGPDIQGNKYGLKEKMLYVFSVYDIDKQTYVPRDEKLLIIAELGLISVPQLFIGIHDLTREQFLELAKGNSVKGCNPKREGIVLRLMSDDNISFKVINNDWLLKYDKGE